MKNLITNTRLAAIALVALFTVSFAASASATETPSAVELKFIGSLKNQPVFQLSFNNAVETEYIVIVRDEFQNVLYKDVIKSSSLTKKFLINTEDLGDANVTFEITDKKIAKPILFEVSKYAHIVQDVVVNKVK